MWKRVLTCVPVLGLFVPCVMITSWVCARVHTFTAVCSGRGEVNCGLPSVNGMSQARYLDWVINSGSRHSYSHCQTAELLTPRIPRSLSLTLSPLSLFNFHTARLSELSIYHHFPFSPCHSCLRPLSPPLLSLSITPDKTVFLLHARVTNVKELMIIILVVLKW